jgi:hypothetical protein
MARKIQSMAYGTPQGITKIFPLPIVSVRAPTTSDTGYATGQDWIRPSTNQAWKLTSVVAGSATWALSSPGASDVDTLTGDAGGPISPLAGDITLAGGTNITSTGGGNTITFALDPAITLATSVTAPLYTASAADVLIVPGGVNDVVVRLGDVAGATFFRVQDSAAADVFTIDSNGTFAALAGLTVTGALTQTAGVVSIAQDNAADAVDIAGGNVARAITLGATGAHTLAIGNVAAGAITVDSAAGISVDAALASNFTVTGASRDLTLASVGGSVNIGASESVADAIVIEASGAAGAVVIKAGTGGLLMGNEADTTTLNLGNIAPTATRTTTIAGGTVVTASVTDTVNVGTGGATTNADSIKTVNVNSGNVTLGQILTNVATGTVTSGTHTTAIATGNRAAGTMATNVMTGTGTKTFNLGNADALTTANIDAITLINDSVNAATSINTGTSTGAVSIGNGLSGAIGVVGGAAVTVDAVGVLELNSSGAIIGLGSDADNFGVNVGTAGERTVTVGSGTGASSTVIECGTGALNVGTTATVHTTTVGSNVGASATVIQAGSGKIDFAGVVGELTADFVDVSGDKITFRASPIAQSTLSTCVVPTGVAATTDLLSFENGMIMEQFIIGTQTILAPRMGAAALGLTVSADLTNAEGKEISFGAARTSSKHSFTIGTSPAFYMQLRFSCNDVSSVEPAYFGFRQTEANNAVYAAYNEFCLYGLNDGIAPGDCSISTRKAAGAVVDTDTNDAWADAATHTLRINVSSAGVTTFLFDGVAPTVTQAFTFTNGIVVHPIWTHLFNASVGAGDEIYWISMEVGFQ